MKIRLVKDGVFPIKENIAGEEQLPQTGYSVSGTIQGEGKLAGTPSLFIRLAGCNLRCSWKAFDGSIDFCDTPYSSHNLEEFEELEVDEIIQIVKQNLHGIKHVIISGGEPTLQNLAVVELAKELKKLYLHITMETNGILFFPYLARYIDLFSISPKLKSSEPDKEKIAKMSVPIEEVLVDHHREIRKNIESIQKYINYCYTKDDYYGDFPNADLTRRADKDFQLKFVISNPEEEDEIRDEYLALLNNWENKDILLMPLGSTQDFLKITAKMTAEMAVRNRWQYCPRVHIDLFDNKQYV
ncbi:MAG: 7-carboxy-7-deazaguanine synthase QueE [Bacteroidetes bacterium]|jgi:7-carboxy-7-deazaguanine synthase|nr:7-carboxy-7-deazaguanine synthase QueE [Bacteroidota bacterium]MBT4969431.1 7-carboxy-7-deazaguanine synthase QueE [Bacteroidota bacterium]MBT5529505.1 7-carboxy-7-deazaguanine synthase QueE [Cytophagia bacterium]MBT7827764.1 7-carboxy-7-deazaguanine synthase QueE [Bacteroidota bacterium]MBT7995765.1 7-carboxy-7-deazaguanine synthase QueE [Bacteroidota bacterium]